MDKHITQQLEEAKTTLKSTNEMQLEALVTKNRLECDGIEERCELTHAELRKQNREALTELSIVKTRKLEMESQLEQLQKELLASREQLENTNLMVDGMKKDLTLTTESLENYKQLTVVNASWAMDRSAGTKTMSTLEFAQIEDFKNRIGKHDQLFYDSYGLTRDAWYEHCVSDMKMGGAAPVLSPRRPILRPPPLTMSPQMLMQMHADGMGSVMPGAGIQGSPAHNQDLIAMAIHATLGTPPGITRVASNASLAADITSLALASGVATLDDSLITSDDDRMLQSPIKKP
jgi:hypothetical protein